MLKTIKSFDKLALNKNNGSKSILNKNNNSILVFERNNNNNKINRFGIERNILGYAKKLGKLKSEKISKFQNLAKLKKKYQKVEIYLILALWRLDQNSSPSMLK